MRPEAVRLRSGLQLAVRKKRNNRGIRVRGKAFFVSFVYFVPENEGKMGYLMKMVTEPKPLILENLPNQEPLKTDANGPMRGGVDTRAPAYRRPEISPGLASISTIARNS